MNQKLLEYKGFECRIFPDGESLKVDIKGKVDGKDFQWDTDTLVAVTIEQAVKDVEPIFHVTVDRALQ